MIARQVCSPQAMVRVYLTPSQVKKYKETGKIKITKNVFKKSNYKINLNKTKYNQLKKGEIDHFIHEHKTGGSILASLIPLAISAIPSIYQAVSQSVSNRKTNEALIELKKKELQLAGSKPVLRLDAVRATNGSHDLKKKNGSAISFKKDVLKRGTNVSRKTRETGPFGTTSNTHMTDLEKYFKQMKINKQKI